MTLELEGISLDPTKAVEGSWFEFYNGSKLKIASSDNPRYRSYLAKLARENRLRLDDDNPEFFELSQKITMEAQARYLLLDWQGVSIGGKALPYSEQLGLHALTSSPKLRDFVQEKSGSIAEFALESVEQAKKSSTGNSNGEVQ